MVPEFKGIVEDMPRLLQELKGSSPFHIQQGKDLPPKGIYVLYEHEQPIYVGRSNNIKNRLRQHRIPSSTHNSAPFAFNLAKEHYGQARGIKMSRVEMGKDPMFQKLFLEAKARVSAMQVGVIGIEEPEKQAIFEIYAALALRTQRYNSFDNH